MGIFGPKKIHDPKDLANVWSKDKQLIKEVRQFTAKMDIRAEDQLIALLLESIERSGADVSEVSNRGRKLAAEDFLSRNAKKLNGTYVKLA